MKFALEMGPLRLESSLRGRNQPHLGDSAVQDRWPMRPASTIEAERTNCAVAASSTPSFQKAILDSSASCRLLGEKEIANFDVMTVHPARAGWILRGTEIKPKAPHRLVTDEVPTPWWRDQAFSVDDSGRLTATWELSDEAVPVEANPGATTLLGKSAVPVEVDGDVWLLPASTYALVRPRQKGQSERTVFPPGCLATSARTLSPAESKDLWEARAKQYPQGAAVFRAAASKGGGQGTVAHAVVAASSYDSFLGVVVHERDAPTCRLDIWNMTTEKPVVARRLQACPTVFWFTDSQISFVDEGKVRRMELAKPLYDTGVAPCPPSPEKPAAKEGKKDAEDAK